MPELTPSTLAMASLVRSDNRQCQTRNLFVPVNLNRSVLVAGADEALEFTEVYIRAHREGNAAGMFSPRTG
ncbi:hypothetical protein JXD38_05125 [candidate division WOR-3 bacterium]|nr:hypothetical protein [candidate division WOR-3 bacterium]